MWLLAQAPDPLGIGSFTQYGIVGLLGVVIALLLRERAQDKKSYLEESRGQRGEMTQAMTSLGQTIERSTKDLTNSIAASHREVTSTLDRQARLFEESIRSQLLMERIRDAKTRGLDLSQDEIDKIYRAVITERNVGARGE